MEAILIKTVQLLLSLSILVVLHEAGHFMFARLFKTRVEKFYLFFNPWFSLFKIKKGKTENYLKNEKLLSQHLVKLGTEKLEIKSSQNGNSFSGENLEALANQLNRYQDYFNQVVKNNIPAGILEARYKTRPEAGFEI